MEVAQYSGDQAALPDDVSAPLELAWVQEFPGPSPRAWPEVVDGLAYLPTHRGTLRIVDVAAAKVLDESSSEIFGHLWPVGDCLCFMEHAQDRPLTVVGRAGRVTQLPVRQSPVGIANLDGVRWLVTRRELVLPRTGEVRALPALGDKGSVVAVLGGVLALVLGAGRRSGAYCLLDLLTGELRSEPEGAVRVGDWVVTLRIDANRNHVFGVPACVRYPWYWVTDVVNTRSGASWGSGDLVSHVPIVGREEVFLVDSSVWQFLALPATSRLPRPRPAPVLGHGYVWAQGCAPDGSRRLAQLDSSSGEVIWSMSVEDWGFLVPAEDGLLRVTRDSLEFYVPSGSRTSRSREDSSASKMFRDRIPFVSRVGRPAYHMAVDEPVDPEVDEAIEQLRLAGWFQQYPDGDEVASSYRRFHGGVSLDRELLIPTDLVRGSHVGREGQGAETMAGEFLPYTYGLFGIEAVQETWWDDENRIDLSAVYLDGRVVTCSFEVKDPEPQGQVLLAHFLRLIMVDRPDLAVVKLSEERVAVVDRARFEALATTGAFGDASILEEIRPGVGPFAYFDEYSSPDL